MKKGIVFISIITVIAILITVLVISGPRVIISIAKRGIINYITGSSVSIGGSRVDPWKEMVLSNVKIKDPGFIETNIKKITVMYSFPAVLYGSIDGIEIDGADLNIDLTEGLPEKLRTAIASASPGFFRVNNITVSGSHIAVVDRDLSLNGTLAIQFSINNRRVNNIDLIIESFRVRDVAVEGFRVAGPVSGAGAAITVKKIAIGNAAFSDISGIVKAGNLILIIDPFECKIFDGSASGNIKIYIDSAYGYSMTLAFKGLSLETFIKDFKLDEKIRLTGKIIGDASIEGVGQVITDIKGSFAAEAPGGTIIIKDPSILENIAKSSKQPADILMESLRNYEYNVGTVKLAVDGPDLALDIATEGEAGKREFYVVLHDMIAKKGGVR